MLRLAILSVVLTCVVVLTWAGPVTAQEPGEATGSGSAIRLFDHFVMKGGFITWLVLIPLSIAAIALIVEHSFSIRRSTILPPETAERIRTEIGEKRYVDAVQFTAAEPSVLSSAVNAGLLQAGNGYASMLQAVSDAIDLAAGRMMRKIEYLSVIGNVSPMIGLFGTVYGMIRLFASIREAGGIPEPARIADDISVALVTTFWGLLVAIPALSVYAFFRNRIDELTGECAVEAEKLLGAFEPLAGGGEAEAVTHQVQTA